MHYHQVISKQLLAIKGVYWIANYKCNMVLWSPHIKEKVQNILETDAFFGIDYLSKDKRVRGERIEIKTHSKEVAWMEEFVLKML